MNLVHLKARLVLKLRAKRAFPLGAGDGIETPIIQALQALLAQGALDAVELGHSLGVEVGEILLFGHPRHGAGLPPMVSHGARHNRGRARDVGPSSAFASITQGINHMVCLIVKHRQHFAC